MRIFRTGGAVVIAGLLTAACVVADFSSDDPGFVEMPGTFVGKFLAVSDADMAGTAYADGKLELFNERMDEVTRFTDGAARITGYASNSVISWPQFVDTHGLLPRAYIVETRGPVPLTQPDMDSVYDEFPSGPGGRWWISPAGRR